MMRVLVTGAGGLLGSDLVEELRSRYAIMGWSRRAAEWETVDLSDPANVRASIRRGRPSVVIHTAAMTDVDACERDPEQAMRINRDGTRAVAAACAEVDAWLLAVSTDYVFDGKLSRPYREEDPTHPLGHYGRSKREGEEAALAVCPRTLVVRVSGLFGRARDNYVRMAAGRLKAGQTVPAVTDQVYSPSYTVDLARAFGLLLAEYERDTDSSRPGGRLQGALHLSNSGGAGRVEVAQWIAQLIGAPESLIRRCTWAELGRPAARPVRTVLDCSRYAALAGTPLRSWKEAVRGFLEAT